jgi:hypothetical protein
VIDFSESDLEKWLVSPITKALLSDLKERKENCQDKLSVKPFASPRSIAEGNKMQGMIENIDFCLAFPTLILLDIQEEAEKTKQEDKKEEGK